MPQNLVITIAGLCAKDLLDFQVKNRLWDASFQTGSYFNEEGQVCLFYYIKKHGVSKKRASNLKKLAQLKGFWFYQRHI